MDFHPFFDEEQQQEGYPRSYISMGGHLIVRTVNKISHKGRDVPTRSKLQSETLNFTLRTQNSKQIPLNAYTKRFTFELTCSLDICHRFSP